MPIDAPTPIPPLTNEQLRYLDHRSRSRLSRFYRVAGPLVTAQTLFFIVVAVLALLDSLRTGEFLIMFAVLVPPAVAAYAARPLLLRRPTVTIRVMNVAVVGALIYGYFLLTSGAAAAAPPTTADLLPYIAVGAYISFHVSGLFWVLSDARLCRKRKAWWHK